MSEQENNQTPEVDAPATEENEDAPAEENAAADAETVAAPEADASEDGDANAADGAGEDGVEEAPADADAAGEEEEAEEHVPYTLGEVEDLPDSVKRFHFEVAGEEFEKKTGGHFEELQKDANIEGFRRGKAPMPLVRVRFGRQVEKETVKAIMDDCLGQIVEEQGVSVFRRFDDDIPEIERDKPLAFAASFEVKPALSPTGYDAFDVEIEDIPLSDDTVAEEVEKIRQANGRLEVRGDDEPVEAGDHVNLDTKVTDADGNVVPKLTGENRPIYSLEMLPAEVREATIGKKKKDSFTVEAPEIKEGDDVTRQASTWEITVREVQRLVLPELDDELARDVGNFESLDALKTRIREDLEKQKADGERAQTLVKIHDLLLERNEFPVPQTLVALTQSDMIQRDLQRLRNTGLTLGALGQSTEEYKENVKGNAEKYLRIQLLLEAIGEAEQLEVTDADIAAALQRMADQSGRKPLALRAQLEAQRRWDSFRDDLRHEKVAELLVERAKVTKTAPKNEDEKDERDEPKED